MRKTEALILVLIALLFGCKSSNQLAVNSASPGEKVKEISKNNSPVSLPVYHAAATRTIDIIHTKLEVSFNWEKQHLYGKAVITLKPYFYPVKDIVLDAKGFDVKDASLLTSTTVKPLSFVSSPTHLTITLDKEYSCNDTLKLFIDYIAKPNERESKTGTAITSDKGLYFINPIGKEKDKPMQIWTQGEPESNSCWFPTIDKPNERMTHEIFITLDSAHRHFVTLSNGILKSSKQNPDGSRTDHWKQSLPTAPYLVMMAIGDYAVIKDKWRNMEVSYYVEPKYAPYAKQIFGNTPEMLEFYSNKLGVPYPWEKSSHVVVRDFVSGAMENNTAVIYGQFLQRTDRELLDETHEDIIAHELFHHWFGNYVTTESWANITLNEGFATYGEYLWKEHKYGRDDADYHGYESFHGYLLSSAKSPKHLIRYDYNDPDEVFDAHSYNKGGAIIHMLRKYVGDEAFFAALKLYLEKNKYSAVEADHLRLAFEEVTGEDLHWFFNQWFFGKGHPSLLIQHAYNDSEKKYFIRITQQQDLNTNPVFKIPLDIDFYLNGKKERKRVWVNSSSEEFSFYFPQKPDFVNVDAEKSIVCTKEEKLSIQERIFQYKNCPTYLDRVEALNECSAFASIPEVAEMILLALNDKNAGIRKRAISITEKLTDEYKNAVKEQLIMLARKDKKSSVRTAAVSQLAINFSDQELVSLYKELVNDSSYSVAGASLSALAKQNSKEALNIARNFESETNTTMLFSIAEIYAEYGNDANNVFFTKIFQQMSGWDNVSFASLYTEFLKKCSDDTINSGVKILEKIARSESNRFIRYFGQKGIKDLAEMYAEREQKILSEITSLKEKEAAPNRLKSLQDQLVQVQNQKQKLESLYSSIMVPN